MENPFEWGTPERLALPERLKQYSDGDPGIASFSAAASKYAYGFNMNGHLINGKREMLSHIPVEYNYFDLMKIKLVKGRYFSPALLTDTAQVTIPAEKKLEGSSTVKRAVVVNQVLYKMLGQPPLDEINPSLGARIIGVCEDYQFFDATQKVMPAYHTAGTRVGYQFFYFKLKPEQDVTAAINRLRSNWKAITAGQPFSFSFLDDEVARGYVSYTKWLKTINAATILAVIIACLGLFGLSALYAVNRTKEVGIRKVLGASVPRLFLLLNRGIVKLALLSFLIAIPLAVYFMNKWLQNFASRIDLKWFYFAIAGLIALLLAVISVSYHAIRTATINPVNSLKSE